MAKPNEQEEKGSASNLPSGNSGGIPGFSFMSELAGLVATRLQSQAAAVNAVWEKVVSEAPYDLRTYTRDLARMWERGFGLVEDLATFPLRYQQGDRPPWFSLVWDRNAAPPDANKPDERTPPDAVKGEIALPKRLDPTTDKVSATRLERLGPDKKDAIDPANVNVRLDDSGRRLSISISNLRDAVKNAGHFVGFVTKPNAPQPIAIVFLTII